MIRKAHRDLMRARWQGRWTHRFDASELNAPRSFAVRWRTRGGSWWNILERTIRVLSGQFILLALLLLAPPVVAQEQNVAPQKLRVAVANFLVNPDAPLNRAVGISLTDALEKPLFETKRFVLVDRRLTQQILQEIRYSEEGLTQSGRQRLKSLNVDILASGAINFDSDGGFRINAKFVKVADAQTIAVAEAQGTHSSEIPQIAQNLVAQLSREVPLEGKIIALDPNNKSRFLINLGAGSNVRLGMSGRFLSAQSMGPTVVYRDAGSFKVVELPYSPNQAFIQPVNLRPDYAPKVGDAVLIDFSDGEAPAPSRPVTVSISTNVAGASVFLDNQAKGFTDQRGAYEFLAVTPGQHTVTVQANGYRDATQTVVVDDGQTNAMSLILEPKPTVLVVRANVPNATIFVDDQARGVIDQKGSLEIVELGPGVRTISIRAPGYQPVSQTVTLQPGGRQELSFSPAAIPPSTTAGPVPKPAVDTPPANSSTSKSTPVTGSDLEKPRVALVVGPLTFDPGFQTGTVLAVIFRDPVGNPLSGGTFHLELQISGPKDWGSDIHIKADNSVGIALSIAYTREILPGVYTLNGTINGKNIHASFAAKTGLVSNIFPTSINEIVSNTGHLSTSWTAVARAKLYFIRIFDSSRNVVRSEFSSKTNTNLDLAKILDPRQLYSIEVCAFDLDIVQANPTSPPQVLNVSCSSTIDFSPNA